MERHSPKHLLFCQSAHLKYWVNPWFQFPARHLMWYQDKLPFQMSKWDYPAIVPWFQSTHLRTCTILSIETNWDCNTSHSTKKIGIASSHGILKILTKPTLLGDCWITQGQGFPHLASHGWVLGALLKILCA